MTRIEPSGQIYRAAKQFHDSAELICEKTNGDIGSYLYPIIVSYALACELALKACEGTTASSQVPRGALLPTAEINSTIWGHKLSELFKKLASNTQQELSSAFSLHSGAQIVPLLEECEDYFIKARYAWENDNKCVFQLSGVRKLSSGLIAAVPSLGRGNA